MLLPITREEFSRLFNSFENSAFRLETLDRYTVPTEAAEYARFLAGEEIPLSTESEWTKLVKKNASAGRIMRRVHAITAPMTPYLKYEICWGYVYSSIAGEQIYLIDRAKAPTIAAIDFWLFDQKDLIFMRYDADGRFLGAEKEDSPEILAIYRDASTSLISSATPLRTFLAGMRSS
ncbi:MAG: DUF6879 family protein [Candidatus Sulfotelmatobacter sp.]